MPLPARTSLLFAGALLCGHAQAEMPATCAGADAGAGPAISLRIDNDILGSQDQGYSNGIQLKVASADLVGRAEPRDPPGDGTPPDAEADGLRCRWPLTDWLAGRLHFLKPAASDRQNLTVSLAQAIFTPTNRSSTGLIRNDRPYAAALLLGLGYNARTGNRLQANLLQVGVVGPSARGRQAQNQIHKLTGDDPFLGWDNQLHDEVVFRLLHERLRRHASQATGKVPGSPRWDAVGHWGASMGNLATHANLGGELRWGRNLPDDFGSTPTRAADAHVAPIHVSGAQPWQDTSFHAFASIDARWILRDISLDGNTFRDSHRVDKTPVVADLGYGIAVARGPWRMVLARFHRTREFRGQKDLPVFGSLTVSRRFSF